MAFHVHKGGQDWLVVEISKEGSFVRGQFKEQRDAVLAAEHWTRAQAAVAGEDSKLPGPPLAERGFGI
ncbi:MAG: hypothetical protein C5B60_10565 [Chloroflexi bacterium]|nr:MAG: hypothetical protein C5B60_10565 [Chloroflexota bacterium]